MEFIKNDQVNLSKCMNLDPSIQNYAVSFTTDFLLLSKRNMTTEDRIKALEGKTQAYNSPIGNTRLITGADIRVLLKDKVEKVETIEKSLEDKT